MATTAAILEVAVRANTSRASSSLKQFDSGLQRTSRTAGTATKQTDLLHRANNRVSSSLKSAAKYAVGAAGAYVSIAAAKDAVQVTTDLAGATTSLHKNFGVAIKTGSALGAIVSARGGEVSALSNAFGSLSKQVVAARNGSDSTIKTFKGLGVSMKDIRKASLEDILFKAADGMKELDAGAARATAGAKLFGKSGQKELVPLMRDGSKAMRDQIKEAQALGATFDELGLKKAQDLAASQKRLELATTGLKVALGVALAPAITEVTNKVADWAKVINDPKLSNSEKFDKIADDLTNIVSKGITKATEEMGRRAPKLAGAFVRGFMQAPILGKILTGAWLLNKLGGLSAAGKAMGKHVAKPMAEAIAKSKIGTSVLDAIPSPGALKSKGKLAGAAFGLAFAAAAVYVLLPEVRKGLEKIGVDPDSNLLSDLTEKLGTKPSSNLAKDLGIDLSGNLSKDIDFGKVWQSIQTGLSQVTTNAKNWIAKNFTGFHFHPNIDLSGLIGKVQDAWNRIKDNTAQGVSGIATWVGKLPGKIGGAFSNAWQKAKTVTGNAASAIKAKAGDIVTGIVDKFRSLPDKIKSAISGIPGAVMSVIGRIGRGIGGIAESIGTAIRNWINDNTLFDDDININLPGPAPDIHAHIPPLYKGARGFAGGLATVNERGVEVARFPDGTMSLLGGGKRGATTTYLPKGTDVFTAGQTSRMFPGLATGTGATSKGAATMQRMIDFGKRVDANNWSYKYGGGHDSSFRGPYDCSGFVSALLHVGGLLSSPLDTVGLKSWGKAGSTGGIVVGVRGGAGMTGHTMMRVGHTYFESGGSNGGGGSIVSGWDGSFPVKRTAGPEFSLKGGATADAATKKIAPMTPKQVFGNKYSLNELVTLAKYVGMKNPEVMGAIAMAESGGDPNNTGGMGEKGLWQILGRTARDFNLPWDHLYDPLLNAKGAKKILDRQGITAWSTYNNRAYRNYLGGKVMRAKLKKLKGVGTKAGRGARQKTGAAEFKLPAIYQNVIDQQSNIADVAEDYAQRAEQIGGPINGRGRDSFLNEQLTALLALRNALINAHTYLMQRMAQLDTKISKMKGGKARKAAVALRGQIAGVDGGIMSSLEDIHGKGSPLNILTDAPTPGYLGGRILAVQMAINGSGVTDTSAGDEVSAQLIRDANNRTAVSEAQFGVLKDLKYLPAFATGGYLGAGKFGIAGEAGPELIRGPAQIFSNSDSSKMVGGGGEISVRLEDNRTIVSVDGEVREVIRHEMRRAGRGLDRKLGGI